MKVKKCRYKTENTHVKYIFLILLVSFQVYGNPRIGDPDGDITQTYIPLDNNYEPDLANSDFDLNKSPLTDTSPNGPGYPTSIENLGNLQIDGSFGSRCNFFQNEMMEMAFANLSDIPITERIRFFSIFGWGDQSEYESQCGPNGDLCRCNPGFECKLTNKLKSHPKFANYDFQSRAGKICLYKKTCVGSDLSPNQACYNDKYNSCITLANDDGDVTQQERQNCNSDATSQCQGLSTQCSYTDLCKKITPTLAEQEIGLDYDGFVECNDNSECSSGYCREFTNDEKNFFFPNNPPSFNKLCVGAAECRPACTPVGQYLANTAQDYCCEEAIELPDPSTGAIKCASPSEAISFGPPMFEIDWNDDNCMGFIYENTDFSNALDSDDSTNFPDNYSTWETYDKALLSEAKMKKYSRSMRAIEFLWTHNPKSGGDKKYDYYEINKFANSIGQRIQTGNNELNLLLLDIVHKFEYDRVNIEESLVNSKDSGNSASAESAAGMANLRTLVNYNDELSEYYEKQANLYYDVLGFKYDPITYGSGSNNNFVSLQDSYDKLRLDSRSSSWPNSFFSTDSLAGMYYRMRFPQSTGVSGGYNQYDTNNRSWYFCLSWTGYCNYNLKCKNQEGNYIKASQNDLGFGNSGDMKNNSVCVKEMARVSGYSGDWAELVDPIHPEGLFGQLDSSSEYSYHRPHFPGARRYKISKSNLKSNIESQYVDYSNEIVGTAPPCNTPQKRSQDRITNSELAMIVLTSEKEKFEDLKGLELEELIEQAETVLESSDPNVSWREKLAQEFTQDYIFQGLLGIYQQDFVRDTFNPGVIGGAVMWAVAVVGMIVMGICTAGTGFVVGAILLGTGATGFLATAIGIGLQNGGTVNSPEFIQKLYDYEFEPILVTANERRSWTCSGSNCYKRKYLNSVSYKSEINKHGLEPYLNMALYMDSYARARQLYHKMVAQCLDSKYRLYEGAYEINDNADYKLNREDIEGVDEAVFSTVTEVCNNPGNPHNGPSYQGQTLDSEDQELQEYNDGVVETPNEKVGKGLEVGKVDISPNLGLGKRSGVSGETDSEAQTAEEREKEIKKLKEDLSKRNNAVTELRGKFLSRLKKLGIKETLPAGVENSVLKHQLANQFKRSKTGQKFMSALNAVVSTSAIGSKTEKNTKIKEKPKTTKKENDRGGGVANNSGLNYKTYGGGKRQNGNSSLEELSKKSSKINYSEDDTLWEHITKIYLKYGIPRLFELEKKK